MSVEEQCELVAADAREDVPAPEDRASRFGECAEDLVAARVAVHVIDALEAVEIDEHDRDVAMTLAKLVLDEIHVVCSPGEAGDAVRPGLFEGALEERGRDDDGAALARRAPARGTRNDEVERGDADVNRTTERARHLLAMAHCAREERARLVFVQAHPEHHADDLRVRRRRLTRLVRDEAFELRIVEDAVEHVVPNELPRGCALRTHSAAGRRRRCEGGRHDEPP